MTDHDRGAYAPQHDAPLAFDPRRAGARHGPPPVTLVASIAVLAAFVIGGIVFYRHGSRPAAQTPQVVGTPIGDIKGAPVSSQAPSDSSAGLQIYKTEVPPASETVTPRFVPAPEQPQPRPIAQPPLPAPVAAQPLRPAEPAREVIPAAKVAPASAASAPAPRAVVAEQTPPTPKVVVAKHTPPPAPKVEVAKHTPPHPAAKVAVAKLTPPAPKTPPAAKVAPEPAASGASLVQIGALSSPALAERAWSDVAKHMGGAMRGKTRKVETTDRDGKTLYRAYVGGFADHDAAASFCAELKAKGTFCLVR